MRKSSHVVASTKQPPFHCWIKVVLINFHTKHPFSRSLTSEHPTTLRQGPSPTTSERLPVVYSGIVPGVCPSNALATPKSRQVCPARGAYSAVSRLRPKPFSRHFGHLVKSAAPTVVQAAPAFFSRVFPLPLTIIVLPSETLLLFMHIPPSNTVRLDLRHVSHKQP